jgi:HEPN domain-containing protein
MNRSDFQQLSTLRIREAKVLFDNSYYAGAYYLAGYAVECALKACITRLTKRFDFPEKAIVNRSHTHNLTELIDVAGLKVALDNQTQSARGFGSNWNIIKEWSENARYKLNISRTEAESIYSAITDRTNGVLPWLKKYW